MVMNGNFPQASVVDVTELTIYSAGALEGSGYVFIRGTSSSSALTNSGLVAPGKNLGARTLFVDGNYMQTSAGTAWFFVDDSAGANSLLAIDGNAILGGTLDLDLTSHFFEIAQVGQTFTIITGTQSPADLLTHSIHTSRGLLHLT